MRHAIGAKVKVIKVIDEEGETCLIGQTGKVIKYSDETISNESPLHIIQFRDTIESYWFEELEEVIRENH